MSSTTINTIQTSNTDLNSTLQNLAAPLGRVLLASIFVLSGTNKIAAYEQTAGWMQAMGVPGMLLPAVIALEIIAGIALTIGWKTRWAALSLAGFSIVSAVIFHADFSQQMEMIMFMKNFALAGGLLFIVSVGAGAFSLDNRKA